MGESAGRGGKVSALIFGNAESIAFAQKAARRAKARKIGPAERATLQIGKMHETYGITEGETCKNCVDFIHIRPGQNIYRKCKRFGISHGPATDWKASYPACGKFQENRPEEVKG